MEIKNIIICYLFSIFSKLNKHIIKKTAKSAAFNETKYLLNIFS